MSQGKAFAGLPIGAKRDDDGVITHLKFKNRVRATPLRAVLVLVRTNLTEGILADVDLDGCVNLHVHSQYKDRLILDDLPEV